MCKGMSLFLSERNDDLNVEILIQCEETIYSSIKQLENIASEVSELLQ